MGLTFQKEEIDALANCQPQSVERMLKKLQQAMAKYGARKQDEGEGSEPQATGAAKPYKPPPKPAAKAATVPKAPAISSGAKKSAGVNFGVRGAPVSISDPSMARLEDGGGDEGDDSLLGEKDAQLLEMRETVDILEVKIQKLEQLVRLKDSKIATLQAKLAQAGI